MDWTNGPLDCWTIFGLFLDYFLDHFLDQCFSTIDSWGGVGRSFSSFVEGGWKLLTGHETLTRMISIVGDLEYC